MVNLDKLLSQMTLSEKIGQLNLYNANVFIESQAGITGPLVNAGLTPDDLYRVGSIHNYNNAEEMITLQEAHLKGDRNKIPMLFLMDVIHGYKTIYPIPLGLGCSFDPELVEECSRMAAREAAAGGVFVNYAPMVDYCRDARWGRIMETCSEDTGLNCIMGAAQVKGYRGEGLDRDDTLASCVKHFAAYGGAEAGRDYNTVELSEHILREFYLPAYKACIDAGADMIMPSFNSLNGVPATANSWLLNTILRDEWGFEGVVVTDYNAISELMVHGVAENGKQAAELAFNCGNHIDMVSSNYLKYLEELVKEGKITEEEIDNAVMRVLKLKQKLGLFEDPYRAASPEKERSICLTPEHRAIARRAATESAVLLKNDGVLPFSKKIKKIALIGPYADNNKLLSWWRCHGENDDTVTVKQGVEKMLDGAEIICVRGCGNECGDTDITGFEAAVDAAKQADAVVLCIGEHGEYCGEGNSRATLGLPGVQLELATKVMAANHNTAVLLFTGRPLAITELDQEAPAIINMWHPGTEGGNAAAELLFGKANPCGKLSVTFPKEVGQCPIYYNHANTGRPKTKADGVREINRSNYIDCGNLPLYSFGHGLSYSNFVYENMSISKLNMNKNETVTVSVTIYNDSNVAGKETVQLYIRDKIASNVRPIQQLAAFKKVSFDAFERKTISFAINEEMLRFWNNENKLVSETGEFEVFTGYADHKYFSENFRLI